VATPREKSAHFAIGPDLRAAFDGPQGAVILGVVNRDVEMRLNRIAQGFSSRDEGALWFGALSESERRDALRSLAAMIMQAHPGPDEVAAAIPASGLRPSHTPAVMLTKGTPAQAAYRIANLREEEQLRAFLLLITLMGLADAARRRRDCQQGCTHWWHHLETET